MNAKKLNRPWFMLLNVKLIVYKSENQVQRHNLNDFTLDFFMIHHDFFYHTLPQKLFFKFKATQTTIRTNETTILGSD